MSDSVVGRRAPLITSNLTPDSRCYAGGILELQNMFRGSGRCIRVVAPPLRLELEDYGEGGGFRIYQWRGEHPSDIRNDGADDFAGFEKFFANKDGRSSGNHDPRPRP